MAIECGMTKKEFLHSTPHDVNVFIDAYNKKQENEIRLLELSAWKNGLYVLEAIATAFDEKHTYPENPLLKEQRQNEIEKGEQKSEEELNQEFLLMSLMVRQANAEIEKKTGGA